MFLNTRSHRFLSRPLAMAFAVACGVSLSSVAQAQMATGSGCTNCGEASAPVVTYSSPATAQYSQPMTQQHTYPARTTVGHSYRNNSCAGYTSTPQHCSSARRSVVRRSVVRHRQPSSSCGVTYSNSPAYSSGGCGSSNGAFTTTGSYPSSGVIHNVSHASTPVMQTGAGCASGNCR